MAKNFFKKLDERVDKSGSLLCIGLDPHSSQIPENCPESAFFFCKKIIDETQEYAAAYKPNSAFFEHFGGKGLDVLRRVIEIIPEDIPIILDCKRGDIDSTAQAYSDSAYVELGADAVTVSPYMGWDSVGPFVSGVFASKGAFVLCRTSNPSSDEIQMLSTGLDMTCIYEKVAQLCLRWNEMSWKSSHSSNDVGLVVGATDTAALRRIRNISPCSWILCPGVGAQGGSLEEACCAGIRLDGKGLLISVSRGISKKGFTPLDPNKSESNSSSNSSSNCSTVDQAGAMADEARCLRDRINVIRANLVETANMKATESEPVVNPACTPRSAQQQQQQKKQQKQFIEFAVDRKALQFGSFTLKSGRTSPYFFNAGTFASGKCLLAVARFYAMRVRNSGIQFDVFFGAAYKGIPLASALAMAWQQLYGEDIEFAYDRKEPKLHGEGGQLVGCALSGRKVLLVDDVITAGTAIRSSMQLLQAAGARVVGVVVCLDRQERTSEESHFSAVQEVEREFGIPVLSLITLKNLEEYLLADRDPLRAPLTQEEENIKNATVVYRQRYGCGATL